MNFQKKKTDEIIYNRGVHGIIIVILLTVQKLRPFPEKSVEYVLERR